MPDKTSIYDLFYNQRRFAVPSSVTPDVTLDDRAEVAGVHTALRGVAA
jgi:hypothetical protein